MEQEKKLNNKEKNPILTVFKVLFLIVIFLILVGGNSVIFYFVTSTGFFIFALKSEGKISRIIFEFLFFLHTIYGWPAIILAVANQFIRTKMKMIPIIVSYLFTYVFILNQLWFDWFTVNREEFVDMFDIASIFDPAEMVLCLVIIGFIEFSEIKNKSKTGNREGSNQNTDSNDRDDNDDDDDSPAPESGMFQDDKKSRFETFIKN